MIGLRRFENLVIIDARLRVFASNSERNTPCGLLITLYQCKFRSAFYLIKLKTKGEPRLLSLKVAFQDESPKVCG
jgi:hypothetical protein